ncbi:Uncharacterised protein [Raoultella planticola]|uniref:Uncharacterized protein n=1 Tax=Raoultella planticola TaxID=575 RepID=A0A485AIZ2_RAOPL|nr:Uncharacterised protein [Raoultella planticola]
MLSHFSKQPVVKGQPGLIWLGIVAVGENPRPGNRHPQAVEAHLRKQTDILRVAMVKIDRDIFDTAIARHAFNDVAKDAMRLYI